MDYYVCFICLGTKSNGMRTGKVRLRTSLFESNCSVETILKAATKVLAKKYKLQEGEYLALNKIYLGYSSSLFYAEITADEL